MHRQARAAQRRLEFLAFTESAGVAWEEPNPGHFKLGPLNYYPSTNRCYFDGARSGPCSPVQAVQLARKIVARPAPGGGEPETPVAICVELPEDS